MTTTIADAAYHTVHDYPGGSGALASRLDKRAASLSHEVRPPQGSTAKLGLLDAVKIMDFTSDHRVLLAMNEHFGYVAVPMPQLDAAHEDTMQQLAQLTKEFSDVLREVATGAADSQITDNELRAIQRHWGEVVSVGSAILASLGAKNAAGKVHQFPTVAE